MDPILALFAAIDRGDLAGACVLLSDTPGAIHARFHGATALHRAAARGDTAMLEVLLERGALLEEPDETGETALAWATDEDRDAAVDLLLSHGARPTLIDLAARGLHLLLERALDADPSMVDQESGQGTALHAAVRRGRGASVRVLLARGADPRLRDDLGRTPAELARQIGAPELAALIDAALVRDSSASALAPAAREPATDSIRYRCGACGEPIVIDIDRTEGDQQRFVEDCPVCCRANVIDVHFERGHFIRISAELE